MNEMRQNKLFNVEGSDKLEDQKMIGGNPTGISNLNENAFQWTSGLYRTMVSNHWIPEKVQMVKDKTSIATLTAEEDRATELTLGYLIFLDSYQCENLPNISKYITLPQVRDLIAIQNFQEVIHTQSYQYLLDSLYPMTSRERIYNLWRDNEVLLERVSYIGNIGNEFQNNPNEENFKKVISMNFILESIYFYNGFIFFHNLASREKLVQTNVMINYIKNDENTHMALFRNIILETFNDRDKQNLIEMIKVAVEHEYNWSKYVYGNKILGMNDESSLQYLHYLANYRSRSLKLDLPFPEQNMTNPYQHLEEISRGNFFEAAAITEYDRADSISGWDF